MIKNIRFRNIHDDFQDEVCKDTRHIKSSQKAFIPADKATNYYKLDKTMYEKLLTNNITSNHKKASDNAIHIVNKEAQNMAKDFNIQDRTECMADRQAYITLKDHKENFQNKPICRLINPAKSEIGKVSK